MVIGDQAATCLYSFQLLKGPLSLSCHSDCIANGNESRKFCGVARMTSPLDWDTTDPDWVPRPDGKDYQG